MSTSDDRQPPPRSDSAPDDWPREVAAPARPVRRRPAPQTGSTPGSAEPPTRAPQGHPTGLPPAALSRDRPAPRYPGRAHPRRGDALLTALLTAALYVLAIVYVRDALLRDSGVARLLDGPQLSTILAVAAPIVLALFSTVFSGLFILRRVVAFWLPIIAAILIVALYSVTQGMLDTAVVNSF